MNIPQRGLNRNTKSSTHHRLSRRSILDHDTPMPSNGLSTEQLMAREVCSRVDFLIDQYDANFIADIINDYVVHLRNITIEEKTKLKIINGKKLAREIINEVRTCHRSISNLINQ